MENSSQPLYQDRIKLVTSFDELTSTPFKGKINAICWPREIKGNFGNIVEHFTLPEGRCTLEESRLKELSLNVGGKAALTEILNDLHLLQELGFAPNLECLRNYPRDESSPLPTDVYSYHVDSANVETDTYLCTYYGSPSEILPNERAQRRVDIPEARQQLLKIFGGNEGSRFEKFLVKNCHHLHYHQICHTPPLSCGLGYLWRLAVDYPDCPVAPCIHRAPQNLPNDCMRLLLIC